METELRHISNNNNKWYDVISGSMRLSLSHSAFRLLSTPSCVFPFLPSVAPRRADVQVWQDVPWWTPPGESGWSSTKCLCVLKERDLVESQSYRVIVLRKVCQEKQMCFYKVFIFLIHPRILMHLFLHVIVPIVADNQGWGCVCVTMTTCYCYACVHNTGTL